MVCALFSSKKVQLSKLHQKRYNFVADGRNTSMVVTKGCDIEYLPEVQNFDDTLCNFYEIYSLF